MFVDSHCHLDFEVLAVEREHVLARARDAGVQCIQTISTKISEISTIQSIIEAYPEVYGSVGIHPHEVATEPAVTVDQLIEYARHPKIIGIGETGLDYYYEHSPRELQQASFRTHIAASRILGLPLIIHTRDADEDTIAILTEEYHKGPFPGLIHCFSTSQWLAEKALSLGLYISISGIITFKKAAALRDSVQSLPLDRLLIETDAPYLAPEPYRGKTNEPAFVSQVATALATLKGTSVETIATETTHNFYRLFTKAIRAV